MPTPKYTALATITLGSTASTVTFGSIPGTYRDLKLVATYTSTGSATAEDSFIRFNSDSGGNYYEVYMYGNGSATGSGTKTARTFLDTFMDQTGEATFTTWDIMDYAQTDKHKSVLIRQGVASGATFTMAGRWASTAAITTVSMTGSDSGSDSFTAGSTWTLYGVK